MKFRFNKKTKTDFGWGKRLSLPIKTFFIRIGHSFALMSKKEKVSTALLLFVALLLSTYKFQQFYFARTVLAPAPGGQYQEALVGEIKYLNPILLTNDAEKSISNLIFRGLVKLGSEGEVTPDLAERWEVSNDGKIYTFYLKKTEKFSDGTLISASDVAFTVDSIKALDSTSSLQKTWANVGVSVIDEATVAFILPQAYGPFIYNINFGILPSHLSSDEFSKKLVGSGPYRFAKFAQDESNKITAVELERNEYYPTKPYLDKVIFQLFSQRDDAVSAFNTNQKINGLFGANAEPNKNYKSTKQLGLIFNLRNERLKDKEIRRKILAGESFAERLEFSLTALDLPIQREKAEQLKAKLDSQNIGLALNLLSPMAFAEVLEKREYELLLYGFDFGFDRDPYAFWHGSQVDQKNYAGWGDKKADILMEDARMLLENDKRNAKYDELYKIIESEYLASFYEPIDYNFSLKSDMIKGIPEIKGNQPSSRFENIEKWYVKEKRVRKS